MKTQTIIFRMRAVVKRLSGSGYKMGDHFKLIVKANGEDLVVTHDAREWYRGRGAKYNRSIKHGDIVKTMTLADLNRAWRPIAQDIKEQKDYAKKHAAYLAKCNDADQLAAEAAKAVNVIGRRRFENYGLTEEKYLTSIYNADNEGLEGFHAQQDEGYRGCGVYRTGWRNGKMTCTLYGGFHGTRPEGVDEIKWFEAVESEMKKHSDHIVKMDGSGTHFFFRHLEDADLVIIATEIYLVPSSRGGLHLNIQPAQAQVVGPQLLK